MDWKTGKRRPDHTVRVVWFMFQHFPSINSVKSSFVWLKDMAIDTENYKEIVKTILGKIINKNREDK